MTTKTTDQIVKSMAHLNKIDDYKWEIIDLIENGMFHLARDTLNNCIKDINEYPGE